MDHILMLRLDCRYWFSGHFDQSFRYTEELDKENCLFILVTYCLLLSSKNWSRVTAFLALFEMPFLFPLLLSLLFVTRLSRESRTYKSHALQGIKTTDLSFAVLPNWKHERLAKKRRILVDLHGMEFRHLPITWFLTDPILLYLITKRQKGV